MNAIFHGIKNLHKKLADKKYRDAYVSRHIKMFLAYQIRSLRGTMSQAKFGKLLGKPQSVVSRLENQTYGKVTVQTLLDIALKLNVALIIRFVDYPTFLKSTDDFSQNALKPASYSLDAFNNMYGYMAKPDTVTAVGNPTTASERRTLRACFISYPPKPTEPQYVH